MIQKNSSNPRLSYSIHKQLPLEHLGYFFAISLLGNSFVKQHIPVWLIRSKNSSYGKLGKENSKPRLIASVLLKKAFCRCRLRLTVERACCVRTVRTWERSVYRCGCQTERLLGGSRRRYAVPWRDRQPASRSTTDDAPGIGNQTV